MLLRAYGIPGRLTKSRWLPRNQILSVGSCWCPLGLGGFIGFRGLASFETIPEFCCFLPDRRIRSRKSNGTCKAVFGSNPTPRRPRSHSNPVLPGPGCSTCREVGGRTRAITRILSGPFIIRVPFFPLFGFNKGTRKKKGQKGTTQEPSLDKGP